VDAEVGEDEDGNEIGEGKKKEIYYCDKADGKMTTTAKTLRKRRPHGSEIPRAGMPHL